MAKIVIPTLHSAPHIFTSDTTCKKNIMKILLLLPLLLYRSLIDPSPSFFLIIPTLVTSTLAVELIQILTRRHRGSFDYSSFFDALVIALLLPNLTNYFSLALIMIGTIFLSRIAMGGLSHSFTSPIVVFFVLYYVNYPGEALINDIELTTLLFIMLGAYFMLFILLDLGVYFTLAIFILQLLVGYTIQISPWTREFNDFISSIQIFISLGDLIIVLAVLTNPRFQPIDRYDQLFFSIFLVILTLLLRFMWNSSFAVVFSLYILSFIIPLLNQHRSKKLFMMQVTKEKVEND